MRRTKIVATLGPATDDPKVIDDLVKAGVDVVRLNFSHGSHDEHRRRAEMVRASAEKQGRVVGVLADLQGPKIRVQRFVNGEIYLNEGDSFTLDMALDKNAGNQERVGVTYTSLAKDVKADDSLLLDDGRVVLEVEKVEGDEIRTKVKVGGKLSNSKGINLQGGGLSAPALTEKDLEDIKVIADIQADYVAVSFVRTADDILKCRELLRNAGGYGAIVAKIERAEAMYVLDEIVNAADAIMIARGDLGVEVGDAELPAIQKELIKKARSLDRVVITATQMMESMIENPIPTRAEVFDVANAVLDGTDAVMLSGETASGKYPAKVIKAMGRICQEAEKQRLAQVSDHRVNLAFKRVDEAIAMATMYTANHLDVKAIAALTESGATVLWMSRISSGIPIYALTRHLQTLRKLTLYRGVYPIKVDLDKIDHGQINRDVAAVLTEHCVVADGDHVIITKGDLAGVDGGTNAMKIICIGNLSRNIPDQLK